MIKLYYIVGSRGLRILWLLEELQIPYEIERYKYFPDGINADPELKKIHPLGKTPIIKDMSNGKVLAESGVIVDYLISKYGQNSELKARDENEEWDVKYHLHYCEGSLQGFLTMKKAGILMQQLSAFYQRFIVGAVFRALDSTYTDKNVKNNLQFLDDNLKTNGTNFMVGNHLTGADIMYITSYAVAFTFCRYDTSEYPNLVRWADNAMQRPAYKRAVEITEGLK